MERLQDGSGSSPNARNRPDPEPTLWLYLVRVQLVVDCLQDGGSVGLHERVALVLQLEICPVCPRSSDPFNIVGYYIKWVTTSWTYSIMHIKAVTKLFNYNGNGKTQFFCFDSYQPESYIYSYFRIHIRSPDTDPENLQSWIRIRILLRARFRFS